MNKLIIIITTILVLIGSGLVVSRNNDLKEPLPLSNKPTASPLPDRKVGKAPEPDQPKSAQPAAQVKSDLITYFENHSAPKNPIRINNIGDLQERRVEFYNLIRPNNFPSIWKGEKPVIEEDKGFIRVRVEGTVKLHSDVSREWLRKRHHMDCIPAEKGENHIILTDDSGAVSLYGDDVTLNNLNNFLNKKVKVNGFYAEGTCEGAACYCYPGIFVKSFNSK